MLTSTKYNTSKISRFINAPIYIREEDFTVKTLMTTNEKKQAYRLRNCIFSRKLKWTPEAKNGLEKDRYDEQAIFFGVFNEENKLCAFLRLIISTGPFMLEKEFSILIASGYKVRKEHDTAEISRLCIANEARNCKITRHFYSYNISMFLYKGIYHWCKNNGIRYLYFVVGQKLYRLLRTQGFPCKLIGEPKIMPNDVVAVGATMDWREFETLNAIRRPDMLKWFSSNQLSQDQEQLQLLEIYSRRPVSA